MKLTALLKMNSTVNELRDALATIWRLIYAASQDIPLDHKTTPMLENALAVLSKGREGDDDFNRLALPLSDGVRLSGVFSNPSRRPETVQQILSDCERLQRRLDVDSV